MRESIFRFCQFQQNNVTYSVNAHVKLESNVHFVELIVSKC